MMIYLFYATVIVEILLGGSLIISLLNPRLRVWPPPGRKSWQFLFIWVLTIFAYIGTFTLGFLDWGSFVLSHILRFPVGIIMMVAGIGLVYWGVRTLGIHASQGLGGELVREGPYRYTRNPQYVGDISIIIGYIILSNSLLVLITGLLGIMWFVLAPFTEEPWLREQFGIVYDDYISDVPRFVSIIRRKDAG